MRLILASAAAVLAAAAPAGAAPAIHAHRGGSLVDGKPAYATAEFQKEIGWTGISTHKATPLIEAGSEDEKPERE